MIYIHPSFKSTFSSVFSFQQFMAFDGKVFRKVHNRETLRIEINNKGYFIKKHRGVGWGEIIKNLIQLKKPIISAKVEKRAIETLDSIGLSVPRIVAYGERGINPAKKQSFIITEELNNIISLETLCEQWHSTPPRTPETRHLKRYLLRNVARITERLHHQQMNHRDLYLAHFVIEQRDGDFPQTGDIDLVLIDLHRAQQFNRLPPRWRKKDLANLLFSSFDADLTINDIIRFIKIYTGKSCRDALSENPQFWRSVYKKALKQYSRGYHLGLSRYEIPKVHKQIRQLL